MLKSKRVFKQVVEYVAIRIPTDSDESEVRDAVDELEMFRKEYYGDDVDAPEIVSEKLAGGITEYSFPAGSSTSGTDYNEQIWPEAVYASNSE